MPDAHITEIFSSVQGEGPWVGQRQIFVRFAGCDISCRYCDTRASAGNPEIPGPAACRVQVNPFSFTYDLVQGRITPEALTGFCARLTVSGPGKPVLSLTGGEPLLQLPFLLAWLPQIRKDYSVYLETSGIHYEGMSGIRSMVDTVSMDFKLPSATGLRPYWEEHARFLAASRGAAVFAKAVVTGDTREEDILTSACLIRESGRSIPLVIQPADHPFSPGTELLIRFQNAAQALIEDVRIIPQVHKMLKVP